MSMAGNQICIEFYKVLIEDHVTVLNCLSHNRNLKVFQVETSQDLSVLSTFISANIRIPIQKSRKLAIDFLFFFFLFLTLIPPQYCHSIV